MNRDVRQVDVAAAVLFDDAGRVLLGQRAEDTHYAGYWEFPGGKLEVDETPGEALERELAEELDIRIDDYTPWIVRHHDYEHARVRLFFFRVRLWRGTPVARVHRDLAWVDREQPDVGPMLPANAAVLKSLRLPETMGITSAATMGVDAQLRALDRALGDGLRLVQIRESALPDETREAFCRDVVARVRRVPGALVVVNDDPEVARALGADGVHLSAARLASLSRRPELTWVGASCHDADEVARAVGLGCDYLCIGPVAPTASHPDRLPLGWPPFARMTQMSPVPVFALGGMGLEHRMEAEAVGAHGIAAIRGVWLAG